jgi:hypothetical protein
MHGSSGEAVARQPHRVVEGAGATLPGIEGERTLWFDAGCRGVVAVGDDDDFAGPYGWTWFGFRSWQPHSHNDDAMARPKPSRVHTRER